MRYILYSPPAEIVCEGTVKANGEVRKFTRFARALYRHKKYTSQRLCQVFPHKSSTLTPVICKTIEEAKEEQAFWEKCSGEVFEIHEYVKGQIGPRIVETKV